MSILTVSALFMAAACMVDAEPAHENIDSNSHALVEGTGGAGSSGTTQSSAGAGAGSNSSATSGGAGSSGATSGTGGIGGFGNGGTTKPDLCDSCKPSDQTCECACNSEEKLRYTEYPTGNFTLVEDVCWFGRTGCACEEIVTTERKVYREWHDGCGDSCDGGCGPANDCVDDPGWTTISTAVGSDLNCDIDWNTATCWTRCEGLDMLTSIGTTWANVSKKTKTLYHVVQELCENLK